MLLKLLQIMEVKQVKIAGFDGYDLERDRNYIKSDMELMKNVELINQMNIGISKKLSDLNKDMKIEFITPTRYKFNNKLDNGVQDE